MAGFESEQARRAEALRLVPEEGLTVKAAAAAVGRSRLWLSKWLQRFNAGDSLEDRSRASSTSFRSSSEDLVDVVVEYRRRLETDPVASVGGVSILAAMERDGLSGLPSVRSIERILTQSGVTRPRAKKTSRSTVPILPLPQVGHVPGVWHQSDWIQDRYLEGGIRYQGLVKALSEEPGPENFPVFVLEEDGEVVGFFELRDRGDHAELLRMFLRTG